MGGKSGFVGACSEVEVRNEAKKHRGTAWGALG